MNNAAKFLKTVELRIEFRNDRLQQHTRTLPAP